MSDPVLLPTLAVRLAGPLLSWGQHSTYTTRHSASDPTLSALQGLLAAAAGCPRDRQLPGWIADLSPVVRIEHAGTTLRDYQTVNPLDPEAFRGLDQLSDSDRDRLTVVRKANGGKHKFPVVTDRFYRSDATYLAFFDDPGRHVEQVLSQPKWALYGGRKACVLTWPLLLGRVSDTPLQAASSVPSGMSDGTAETVTRRAFTFADPSPQVPVERIEDRHDRMVQPGAHRSQRRWYVRLTVPVASSWGEVVSGLRRPDSTDLREETPCSG